MLFNPPILKANLIPESKDFHHALKAYRLSNFMSARDLAKKLNCNASTVLDWEHNKFKPNNKICKKLILIIRKNS